MVRMGGLAAQILFERASPNFRKLGGNLQPILKHGPPPAEAVPKERFELSRVAPPGPKPGASANFATSA